MRVFPSLTFALGIALFPSLAFSSGLGASVPPSPTPWLKTVVEKGRHLAERKVEPGSDIEKKWHNEIRGLINDTIDWDELTRQTLGAAWEQRSPKERTEFAALLREMIEASYESKLRTTTKDGDHLKKPAKVEITWLDESVSDGRADATARVKSDKNEANLGFKLRWNGDRWRVYDLAIDDVSTVRTYRTQFTKKIASEGFPALLDRMRKKTSEIRAGLANID
jgi:phospholipid transport system substrate-binding protein